MHNLKADIVFVFPVFVFPVFRGNVPVASSQKKPKGKVLQQAGNLRQFPFNYAVVFRTKF